MMMWKKIVDSGELMIYEQVKNDMQIRIEARLAEKNKWQVFKKYSSKDSLSHVEDFMAGSKDELKFILSKLMKKNHTTKQLEKLKLSSSKLPRVSFKRDFKEYCMEKWKFTVDSEKIANLVFIKFDEMTELDIIMHEKYKPVKDRVMEEISTTFNLDNQDTDVSINIFFYGDSYYDKKSLDAADFMLGNLEIGYESNEQD